MAFAYSNPFVFDDVSKASVDFFYDNQHLSIEEIQNIWRSEIFHWWFGTSGGTA